MSLIGLEWLGGNDGLLELVVQPTDIAEEPDFIFLDRSAERYAKVLVLFHARSDSTSLRLFLSCEVLGLQGIALVVNVG